MSSQPQEVLDYVVIGSGFGGSVSAMRLTEKAYSVLVLDAGSGVVGLDCQMHNYPGLYVVDASIMPANPGVNPSLTIMALAEYAMSQVPAKSRTNS